MTPDAAYPSVVLDNGELQALVYLPDAGRGYYRGSRFDWSGIVARVELRGHRFYAPLHARHDPVRHDALAGPAEEFAMFAPMGYAEAGAGEAFVKIGVGLLRRLDSADYRFDAPYPILHAGDWRIESTAASIDFEQQLVTDSGWGYRYLKRVQLMADEPGLVLTRQLENTGTRAIDIDHYNHNFTLIDDRPYGPDYSVEFPFASDAPRSIDDIAWFRGNRIDCGEALGERSLWIELFEGRDPGFYNAALVRNDRSGAAVAFRGDAPVERMVFWAVERAACPEPFIRIRLLPGEAMTWSSHYRYHVPG
ncbi:MAG: hypothetical protein QNJ85_11950 [Gammaproteobacteria bacterium]|nr:hypothetical protein [Gammaproteobacteria bacterium]